MTCFCASFGCFLLCGWNFLLSHKHTHWHFVFYEIRLQNLPVYSHTWIIERERQTKAAREWEGGGGAFCLTSVCFLEAGRSRDWGRGRGGERERESGGGLGNDAHSDVSILSHCLITNAHTHTYIHVKSKHIQFVEGRLLLGTLSDRSFKTICTAPVLQFSFF